MAFRVNSKEPQRLTFERSAKLEQRVCECYSVVQAE